MSKQTFHFDDPSTLVSPEARVLVPITEQDYLILLEGSGNSLEKGARDAALGVLATSVVGLVGVIATVDLSVGGALLWKPVLLVIGLAVIALMSAALMIFFWTKISKSASRASFKKLCERIELAIAPSQTVLEADFEEGPPRQRRLTGRSSKRKGPSGVE